MPSATQDAPRLVSQQDAEILEVMGPTIQFLVGPEDDDDAICIMRGTIPAGVSVPLHSHPEPETFVEISGEVEGLIHSGDRFEWVRIRPGDVFHVPGGAKHAFRNRFREPAVSVVITTSRLGRFFREVGTAATPGARPKPPSADAIRRLLAAGRKYGHWAGTPEENARVGLSFPSAA